MTAVFRVRAGDAQRALYPKGDRAGQWTAVLKRRSGVPLYEHHPVAVSILASTAVKIAQCGMA
jgi:hypothetical protein